MGLLEVSGPLCQGAGEVATYLWVRLPEAPGVMLSLGPMKRSGPHQPMWGLPTLVLMVL